MPQAAVRGAEGEGGRESEGRITKQMPYTLQLNCTNVSAKLVDAKSKKPMDKKKK